MWVRRPDDAGESVEPIAETEAALQEYLEADDTDLDGGPCMRDDEDAKVREPRMAKALDAVVEDGLVVGGINLYASEPDAFSGHHDALADALGASAGGAVADGDLSFLTRRMAQQAPTLSRENRDVEVAVGLLAALHQA
jgi:hypothetical protein